MSHFDTVRDYPGNKPTAEILAAVLADQDLSVRGAARLCAAIAPGGNLEAWRRALNRYLAGADPEPANAEIMEQAFNLEPGRFPRHVRGRPEDATTMGERMLAIERRQAELAETVASHTRTLRALTRELRDVRRGLANQER